MDSLKPLSELIFLKGKRSLIIRVVGVISRTITFRFKEELLHFNKESNIIRVDLSKKNSDTGVNKDVSSYTYGALIAVDGSFLSS
jgi:hypothetical protein